MYKLALMNYASKRMLEDPSRMVMPAAYGKSSQRILDRATLKIDKPSGFFVSVLHEPSDLIAVIPSPVKLKNMAVGKEETKE